MFGAGRVRDGWPATGYAGRRRRSCVAIRYVCAPDCERDGQVRLWTTTRRRRHRRAAWGEDSASKVSLPAESVAAHRSHSSFCRLARDRWALDEADLAASLSPQRLPNSLDANSLSTTLIRRRAICRGRSDRRSGCWDCRWHRARRVHTAQAPLLPVRATWRGRAKFADPLQSFVDQRRLRLWLSRRRVVRCF